MYKYTYIKLRFQILFRVWLMTSNGSSYATAKFYSVINSYANHEIQSRKSWHLFAVSISIIII